VSRRIAGPSPSVLPAAFLILLGGVGAIDSMVGDHWDLLVLFALVLIVGIVVLVMSFGPRRQVSLRADLFSTLQARALRTGEPLDQLLDRSVATYLDALDESRPPRR
jgi:hypothetical protein